MKYLWTEDTGAGLHFQKLVNQLFFDNALVVESKESNQGILYSLTSLNAKEEDEYYIAFDYTSDIQVQADEVATDSDENHDYLILNYSRNSI